MANTVSKGARFFHLDTRAWATVISDDPVLIDVNGHPPGARAQPDAATRAQLDADFADAKTALDSALASRPVFAPKTLGAATESLAGVITDDDSAPATVGHLKAMVATLLAALNVPTDEQAAVANVVAQGRAANYPVAAYASLLPAYVEAKAVRDASPGDLALEEAHTRALERAWAAGVDVLPVDERPHWQIQWDVVTPKEGPPPPPALGMFDVSDETHWSTKEPG